ncbi:hypothetical protein [Peribacillus aracenensis]|uniref:hypothetical protein n=1 Tax=Peribacillus aracenensis TaxID=2976708 RepID=UPI0021A75A5A|nr:hypothetical protein [Peribacillus sp. BBB004]
MTTKKKESQTPPAINKIGACKVYLVIKEAREFLKFSSFFFFVLGNMVKKMNPNKHYIYTIKDEYFEDFPDQNLKNNKG